MRQPEILPVPDKLPDSWRLEEIGKATPPYSHGPEGVYVLAWVVQGNKQRQSESCLVMRVLSEDDGYGRWHLTHLYRDPSDRDRKWQTSMMHVLGDEGTKYGGAGLWIFHSKRFKNQPTNKDLYAACADNLEGVMWNFVSDVGTIGCGVCEQNWQKVTGEKPTQFFNR